MSQLAHTLAEQLQKALIGKPEVVRLLLTGLFARGHVLIEDLPGLGKTTLARALAQRFPYIAPLNFLQVELLRRWRSGEIDDKARVGILIAINGVAAGLRNSG